MRRWRVWLVPFALLAALVGGPAGVGAEEPPPIAPFTTARVRIEGTVSAQGQVLPVQGEGEIDATRGASHLTIAVLGAAFETIVVDGRTYSRSSLTGRWEYTDGAQAGGFNPARLAPYDPATIRAAGRNFTRIGPEMVGGVATTHWRADADLDRLLGLGSPAASGAGLGQTAATMDLWIGDADQRLHRLAVETQPGASAPGTPTAAGQALTLTFDSFDAPVSIIAPPGAVPATPGAFGGAGAAVNPVARTPVATAPAAANVVATRNAERSAASAAPAATTSTSSLAIVRLLGGVALIVLTLVGLLAIRHRRARAGERTNPS